MLILGAKGHAIELLDCLSEAEKNQELCFFDDVNADLPERLYGRFPILRSIHEAAVWLKRHPRFALGIGMPKARYQLAEKLQELGGELTSIVSPSAHIGAFDVQMGVGLNIMHGVLLSNSTRIGEGSLLNTASGIHHDVQVGAYCEISPGARLLGGSHVGDFCRVGSNATILPRVKIGHNVQVGAGAVVTTDVADHSVVVGVPARVVKQGPPPPWWPLTGTALVGQ
jgi:sugar O-acyltransferase (sialic acid O-acetyltransferase NeuD family)